MIVLILIRYVLPLWLSFHRIFLRPLSCILRSIFCHSFYCRLTMHFLTFALAIAASHTFIVVASPHGKAAQHSPSTSILCYTERGAKPGAPTSWTTTYTPCTVTATVTTSTTTTLVASEFSCCAAHAFPLRPNVYQQVKCTTNKMTQLPARSR